jgi:hypothetical protein
MKLTLVSLKTEVFLLETFMVDTAYAAPKVVWQH